MKEISVKEFTSLKIGQCENKEAATGCTVIISEEGMRCGISIQGGGPAARESQLLNPLMAAKDIHAIVLGGGSAFGLSAANGVMNYLEEKSIGYDVGITKVPLVVQSDIFDLTVGDFKIRPDEKMGYKAAKNAFESPNYQDGNYGVGCGATVGKIKGMKYCMKSGIGSFAISIGKLKIGAIVVVNALGDIFDDQGHKIAGVLNSNHTGFDDTLAIMQQSIEVKGNKFTTNTTLAAIMTNAYFDKSALCKIAQMGHDGFARSISPVHTSADGDSIYAISCGTMKADMDLVGILGAKVISQAIIKAIYSASKAYHIPSIHELRF